MTTLPPSIPLPGTIPDGPLPPAQPGSFGTGTENPSGLRLAYRRERDLVRGTTVLDARFEGAAGVAHGGIVATLLDDVTGAVLRAAGQRAVTAQLDVSFLRPVLVEQPLTVEGWLVAVDGRKHQVVGRVLDGEHAVAVARALYVVVPAEHYERLGVAVPAVPAA